MRKIICVLILTLFLTGCDVSYRLEFIDEDLTEKISLTIPINEEKSIDQLKNLKIYAINNSISQQLYNVDYNEGLFNFNAQYIYTYGKESFRHALYANECFEAFSFVQEDDNYILSTSEGFKCMSLYYYFADNINIEIKTNHVVIENNADQFDDNTYIWNINNENANSKKIYIKFGEVKERNFFEKIVDFIKDNKTIFIIGGTVALAGSIIVIYIVVVSKKNNEI